MSDADPQLTVDQIEFWKTFPNAPDDKSAPVSSFKCYLNERTSRGTLFITTTALYFVSTMMGKTKQRIPYNTITEFDKVEHTLNPGIQVVTENEKFLFSGFLGSNVDSPFAVIKQYNKDKEIVEEHKDKHPVVDIGETLEKLDEKEKELEQAKKKAVEKAKEEKVKAKEAPPTSPVINRAANPIRDSFKQAKLAKESSEAIIKQRAKALREKTEKVKPKAYFVQETEIAKQHIIHFFKKFLVIYFFLFFGSIVLGDSLIVSTWGCLAAVSIFLACLDIALSSKNCSKLLTALVLTHLSKDEPAIANYLALCFLYLIHIVFVLTASSLLEGFDITFTATILCVLFINVIEIARIK